MKKLIKTSAKSGAKQKVANWVGGAMDPISRTVFHSEKTLLHLLSLKETETKF
jgi:hypothetical protein